MTIFDKAALLIGPPKSLQTLDLRTESKPIVVAKKVNRDQTSILDNEIGEIRIRKTKAQSPIVKDLKRLKLFLEKFDGDNTILKIMA